MTDGQPWRDAETLERLYHGEELTQQEVADRLGCDKSTVGYWMKKNGVECRSPGPEERPWADRDRLYAKYWDEEKTTTQIAEEWGCSRRNINTWLNRHEIEQRPLGESIVIASRGSVPKFETRDLGHERWINYYRGEKIEVLHHRLLAVAEWGFDALRGMHVHHKNNVRWDNRIENLELLTPSEHKKKHPIIERREDGTAVKVGTIFEEESNESRQATLADIGGGQ